MSEIRVHELAKSRRFTVGEGSATGETKFIAYRSDDYQAVYQAVSLVAPQTLEGLNFKGFSPMDVGGGVWEFTANYALPREAAGPDVGDPGAPPADFTQGEPGDDGVPGSNVDPVTSTWPSGSEPLGPEWSVSTVGGTEKVLRGYFTVAKSPVDTPDYKGMINVTEGPSGGVEGVELVAPKLELTCKKTHPFVTHDYIRMCAYLTGTINRRKCGSYPPGEVLFLGVEMQQDQKYVWQATYKFLIARTERDIDINNDGMITFDEKLGHDYLWVRYEQGDAMDPLSRSPKGAYIERVYIRENLNKLWI